MQLLKFMRAWLSSLSWLSSSAFLRLVVLVAVLVGVNRAHGQTPIFEVAKQVWTDSLGNHRLAVEVRSQSSAVEVKVDWRRRDKDAADKALIITDSKGQQIHNIKIDHLNRETAVFYFEPVSGAGTYYIYYMPWSGHKWEGGFEGDYLHHQPKADQQWLDRLSGLTGNGALPIAHNLAIQARTAFDSFYPMEVVAKKEEVFELIKRYKDPYLLFAEDRRHPIKMLDDLPLRWIEKGPENGTSKGFSGVAERNEYYVFQIGVFASRDSLSDIHVTYKNAPFPVTCFNTGGVDSKGRAFIKKVKVAKGHVQPLWFGVDIPRDATPGNKDFTVQVQDGLGRIRAVKVRLTVENKLLSDRGDNELWRLSRLRWLNSRLGINDHNTAETKPLMVENGNNDGHDNDQNDDHDIAFTIAAGSGSVKLNKWGLPAAIDIGHKDLLAAPISFDMDGVNALGRLLPVPGKKVHITSKASGKVSWEAGYENKALLISYLGQMESDGYLRYKVIIKAKQDVVLDNMQLDVPVKKELATYFMGMGSGKPFGRNGGYTPVAYNWKWAGPQNSYWIGTYDAGIYCKLLGATYNGPMLNLYHPAPPPSWYNENKGGFKINTVGDLVRTSTYTGSKALKKDSVLTFEFSLLITPVKKLDTHAQFTGRYYQNYGNPYPPEADIKAGVNIINVHHANRINPYINYPFVIVDSMRAFVNRYHKQGVKTKIYYTIRELSNQCAEIWALHSLGTEIFSDGNGGGYPWLREHLMNHYNVQWFTPIDGYEACDAAIKTSGDSRWYNYYVEGLRWLVSNVGIDGLYLDDVAYDRDMLKRMRKVMDMVKPGCLIDLHSNTDFSKGPATQYTEFFPYINKLWFGENFHYNQMQPDNWLVETSGIPFGLMGDMLFSGGNPWRGMVYGMTNRDGWPTDGKICNPKPIWKELDHFGIREAQMYGYWEPNPGVQVQILDGSDTDADKDNDNDIVSAAGGQTELRNNNTDDRKQSSVLATTYKSGNKLLIAVASWQNKPVKVQIKIYWQRLGLTPRKYKLVANSIKDFQQSAVFKEGEAILVDPEKGWLLEVE